MSKTDFLSLFATNKHQEKGYISVIKSTCHKQVSPILSEEMLTRNNPEAAFKQYRASAFMPVKIISTGSHSSMLDSPGLAFLAAL